MFTDENLIANVLSRAAGYHSNESYTAMFLRNFHVYDNTLYRFLFIAAFLFFSGKALFSNAGFPDRKSFAGLLTVYGILFILPFLFFVLFGPGYAYNHHYMAYRNLSVSFAAPICIVMHVAMKRN